MYWYDGKLIDSQQLQLDIADPGLLYGATAFTTMRIYEESLEHPLTDWQAHCDRLKTTQESFGWHQPSWSNLRRGAESLLRHFPVLRMVIFPDGREWITGRNLPPLELSLKGITAWIANDPLYRRSLAQHKTGNYLAAYLARERALSLNAREAILLDADSNWLETSTGNLWGHKEGIWYTPSLDSGILPGIARSRWLDFLTAHNQTVVENTWSAEFSQTLEALSYSNCVVEMIPIKTVFGDGEAIHYSIKLPRSINSKSI